MISARILLVGGDDQDVQVLLLPFTNAAHDVEIVRVDDAEQAIHDLVVGGFQLCVIHNKSDDLAFALSICTDCKEAGIRIPIIVLTENLDQTDESPLIAAGGYIATLEDGTQNAMLKNLVNLTVDLRKTEETLRKTNDRLMMEMRTLQDERERAETLNSEYVELMENYALAKEDLEKINQEKDKFFSIIAHDLRSPFTGLIGFSTLLKENAETYPLEKIKLFAQHIYKSSDNIFKLLENLLEWARLQMNRVSVVPELFLISNATQKTFGVLMPIAAKKEIALVETGTPTTVYADPHMADAIIRNLVNNAIKFSPHRATITIHYDNDAQKNIATISIRDTGIGMDENTAAKLFKMSESVSTRGTDGEEGTGLGLLLCKELIHRNKGTISVLSTLGEGSTFTFTLPMIAPPEKAA
ncbi:MAG: HAMP domain-containing histidine kinase [Magnetovibrio sp.]|nr:HAMP domain-containing histidine kinase [Magnetovibrio sp.]